MILLLNQVSNVLQLSSLFLEVDFSFVVEFLLIVALIALHWITDSAGVSTSTSTAPAILSSSTSATQTSSALVVASTSGYVYILMVIVQVFPISKCS